MPLTTWLRIATGCVRWSGPINMISVVDGFEVASAVLRWRQKAGRQAGARNRIKGTPLRRLDGPLT